jgi:hypothetical protein
LLAAPLPTCLQGSTPPARAGKHATSRPQVVCIAARAVKQHNSFHGLCTALHRGDAVNKPGEPRLAQSPFRFTGHLFVPPLLVRSRHSRRGVPPRGAAGAVAAERARAPRLLIWTATHTVGRSSFQLSYRTWREGDEVLIATAHSVQVWLDQHHRPTPLPSAVREALTTSLCPEFPTLPARDKPPSGAA